MLTFPESIMQPDEVTVGDLLQILIKFPEDMKVTYPNPEGGFHPIHMAKPMILALNVNDEYWYGKHDYPSSISPDELASKKQELCLILTK